MTAGAEGDRPRVDEAPTVPLGAAEMVSALGSVPVGARLAGRYTIVRFVARGGMGEVYEAEDGELGATVALKTVRPSVAADPDALARFRREIQVARKVTHPNVCRVFDLGVHPTAGGAPMAFFTMELLRGETLAQRLRRGTVARAEARRILADVVAGLAAAHEAGVVHRDLKPANVMLLDDGRAVITDFGLAVATAEAVGAGRGAGAGAGGGAGAGAGGGARAGADAETDRGAGRGRRAADAETDRGAGRGGRAAGPGAGVDRAVTQTAVAGTPSYMAPEVLGGDPPTRASDLYALGVVMYELQTGRVPRPARDLDEALRAAEQPPPASRAHALWRDRRWEAATARCLAAAAARPRDARAVLAAVAGRRVAVVVVAVMLVISAIAATAYLAWPRAETAPAPNAIRPPASPAAAAAYHEGLALLRDREPIAARARLRTAVELAPGSVPTLAALAAAELAAGDPIAARATAARAGEAVQRAPERWTQAERLLVEARRKEADGDWKAAADAWTALERFDPARREHGIALAYAHVASGALDLARADVEALRARPGGADDPYVHLVDYKVTDRQGDLAAALALGRRIAAAGEAFGSQALIAEGYLAIGAASMFLGDAAASRAALDRADAGYVARGNPLGRAEVMRMRSAALWIAGELDQARAMCEQALALSRASRDRRGEANALGSLSALANTLGDYDAAFDHATRAAEAYRDLGDAGQMAWAAQQLGSIHYNRGDIEVARERWLAGLTLATDAGERLKAGELAFNLGEASLELGDLGAARLYLDQALASFEAVGNRQGLAQVELDLAELLISRDDRDGAKTHLERARAIWTELGERPKLFWTSLVEAQLAQSGGRAHDALAIAAAARDAAALVAGDAAAFAIDPSSMFTLASIEVEAGLAAADVPAAVAALARARAAYPAPPPRIAIVLDLLDARVLLAQGHRDAALARARACRDAITPDLPHPVRLEVLTGVAELERLSGDPDASARLRALADDAANHGLPYIARRARAASEAK